MTDTAQDSFPEVTAEFEPSPPPEPPPQRVPLPLLDRTGPLFALFLGVGLIVFVAAFLTVHQRDPQVLTTNSGAKRSFMELSHWLRDGYFHNCGLFVPFPLDTMMFYRNSTGGRLVSTFVAQKLHVMLFGHYSWRLVAWHNQLLMLLLSALLGLLAYRVTRRIGLDARLAFAAGASVVIVIFTFPDNLLLYWEMSAQAYALIFATMYLLIEERCTDGGRTLKHTIAQAVVAFLMTYMEYVVGLAFISATAASLFLLEPRRGAWRRFLLVAVVPCLAAFAVYGLQLHTAKRRFPNVEIRGSAFMTRTGLDGESIYYLDHLDIAWRRDVARANFPFHRDALFRWKWVFILGSVSTLVAVAAYVARRLPRIAVEVLTSLTGTWILYAAVFSEAIVIHPYYYDLLLFAPLVLALFAIVPALAESLTRRTGAILMVVVFCACWYTLFQFRLYALWFPMPGAQIAPPPAAGTAR